MTTFDYAIRDPRDVAFYHDTIRRVHEADDAITEIMRDQAKSRQTQRKAERQYDEVRSELAHDIAGEAAEAGKGSPLGNADGRAAELRKRLARHQIATACQQMLDAELVTQAELDVKFDAAVRQRKTALAALAYATAFLTYIATEEKQR